MTTLMLMALVAASFVLGFVPEMTIAWRFGGSWMADAFFVCLILAVFFKNLLGIAMCDGVIAHLKGGHFPTWSNAKRRNHPVAALFVDR